MVPSTDYLYKTAAVYRDKKLERIDLKTGQVVEALRPLATPGALQETYSADSRFLVVRFQDGSFVQYRLPFDGKEASRFRLPQDDSSTPRDHQHIMQSISADGRFVTLLTRRSLYMLRLPPLDAAEKDSP